MKDQHKHIKGYRDLSAEEIALMNEAKELAEQVGQFVDKLGIANFADNDEAQIPDQRWVSIAKTDLQKGFMGLVRSIAKPTTF